MRYSRYWFAAHNAGIPVNVIHNMLRDTIVNEALYSKYAIRHQLVITNRLLNLTTSTFRERI